MRYGLWVGLLLLAGCAGAVDQAAVEPEFPTPDSYVITGPIVPRDGGPESWHDLDPARFNAVIEAAVASGEDWTRRPLRLVVAVFGDDTDTREMIIEEKKNFGQGANEVQFTVIRDGFLDDSLRGDWREIVLARQPDGTWRVTSARAAYRCWRGDDTETYRARFCP